MRENREKAALSLHRYKNWIEIIEAKTQELAAIKRQMDALIEQIVYAHLEAREEQEHLIALGLSKQNLENVGMIPHLNLDPLTILRRAGIDDRLLEGDGILSQEGQVPRAPRPVPGNPRPHKVRRVSEFPKDSGIPGEGRVEGDTSRDRTQEDRVETEKEKR